MRTDVRRVIEVTEREPAGRLGPDVDLLIHTGGERRLADFLLWECAHAELCFLDTPWQEFGEGELAAAMAELQRRRRGVAPPSGEGPGASSASTVVA